MVSRTPALFLASSLAIGCADEATEIEVRAWGEHVEGGIAAEAFSDGWAVEFSRFEVTLRSISIAGQELADPEPLELSQPSGGQGQLVGRVAVPAGDYDDGAFAIERMEVEGSASKDGVSKSFAWSFPLIVYYSACETSTTVPAGGVGTFQISVHPDHLFHDSLVAEQPAVRFDALAAADSDGDDVITMQELSAAGLGDYDASDIPDVENLAAFVGILATTTIHVDGEQHCAASLN
jgi:hypothetical protein